MVVVAGFGQAFPHTSTQTDLWDRFFSRHFSSSPIARRLFGAAGVSSRHAVADPIVDDVSGWTTAARMRRYVDEAVPLGKRAVQRALSDASIDPGDVGLFVVVSCTGYATPGVDSLVAQELQMSDSMRRLVVGHMGCYGALPGLNTVSDFVSTHQQPAILLCLELASLHLQPPTNDVEQMLAHALFSDAASAVVVDHRTRVGLRVVDSVSLTDWASAELMTWRITDHGFRMTLSQRVPDVLELHVRPTVEKLLDRNGLAIADVGAWAVHPGGPRILDVVEEQLELKPDDLAASRSVLDQHGNCSSATVLIVLDEIRRLEQLPVGSFVVAVAFGPGLTLCATLLQPSLEQALELQPSLEQQPSDE